MPAPATMPAPTELSEALSFSPPSVLKSVHVNRDHPHAALARALVRHVENDMNHGYESAFIKAAVHALLMCGNDVDELVNFIGPDEMFGAMFEDRNIRHAPVCAWFGVHGDPFAPVERDNIHEDFRERWEDWMRSVSASVQDWLDNCIVETVHW